ncbi:TauD/TfdA family dioxygenase [Sphingorhabdus sp. 109]|uniref:TauD/TfdA family dioxygenase n=1 Tax=Sphingorhabdus sp. 109 TaxID=2653173 RepID=UPI0012F33A04|nr:TauD/TfdA family dioxygenase [Sphingorhabdus sp. 109]VWX61049.1 hypothetical protein SPHINGOR109_50981 [Sphingorhabdus sp. 109]
MRIEKAGEAVGAIVEHVDVTSLSDQQFADIRRAFLEHGSLFFRDQKLTPRRPYRLCQTLGRDRPQPLFQAARRLSGNCRSAEGTGPAAQYRRGLAHRSQL